MIELRWLPEAKHDIERLHGFLFEKSPQVAETAVRLILGGASRLLQAPHIGKPLGDGSGDRDLFLPFGAGAYVLRYRLVGSELVIIRVWHGRELR